MARRKTAAQLNREIAASVAAGKPSPIAYAHHSNLPDLRPASERGTVADPADRPSALSPGLRAALAKLKAGRKRKGR